VAEAVAVDLVPETVIAELAEAEPTVAAEAAELVTEETLPDADAAQIFWVAADTSVQYMVSEKVLDTR